MSNQLQDAYLPKKVEKEIEEVAKKLKLSAEQKEKLREVVAEEYMKSRFEPGEAIGILTAQSISEPSTQLSLHGDEKILVKIGEELKPIKIGEFVDGLMQKYGFKREGFAEVLDLPPTLNFFVYSLDKDEKLKLKRIKAVIRHKAKGNLLEIKTKSGRKIRATPSHSFVIRKSNTIAPIKGSELKIGDRIPVARRLHENCLSSIDLSFFVPQSIVKNDRIYPYIAHSKSLPKNFILDENFGEFLGAYLAEGNVTRFFVNISNRNSEFNKVVEEFAQRFCLHYKAYEYKKQRGITHDTHIYSTLLVRFLKAVCGEIAEKKKLPSFVFSANEKFVSGLLRTYFDGDGNISVERKMIRAFSKSEELIDGIKLLLLRFGIFSYKKRDRRGIWWLLIPYKYAPLFLEKIGSNIKERREKLKKLASLAKKFWIEKSLDYNDMIVGFDDLLYRIAKKLKYPTRYVNNFTKRQKIGRTTLYRYIALFKKLAKEKGINIKNEISILERAFNSDVIWDEIVEIKRVEASEWLYDISVDGLETFLTFDGIVTHNTMRTYHFAGTAGLKVTLGLPRLMEIFDAKKKIETPMMKIYLKKEYNTKEFAEKFAERIIEKKVSDFVENISVNLIEKNLELEPKDRRKLSTVSDALKTALKGFEIKVKGEKIIVSPKEELPLSELQKLKERVLDIAVEGIKGVISAIITREEDYWVVNTIGTNLSEVLKLEEVNENKTISSDIYEVAEIFGIEAARNVIIREAYKTMQEQGLDVDIRYLSLVADIMTWDGEIRPIGRYGVAGAKTSVLARAAFEETMKHLIRASVRNEVDEFRGIFENVMANQVARVGTGMFDLYLRGKEDER